MAHGIFTEIAQIRELLEEALNDLVEWQRAGKELGAYEEGIEETRQLCERIQHCVEELKHR